MTRPPRLTRSSRIVAIVAVTAVALFAVQAALAAGQQVSDPGTDGTQMSTTQEPARAKPSKNCAKQIIADWFPDQRIDLIYELPCYRAAIKALPRDVLVYTDAPADMQRALSFARRNKPDPGRPGSEPAAAETTDTTDTAVVAAGPGGGSPDTAGPSSVPVPLIVLGGLAVLLLAAGGAGYISRRMRAEAEGDGDASAAS